MEHFVWTWPFFHIHGQLISSYNPVTQQAELSPNIVSHLLEQLFSPPSSTWENKR